jgi:hypothetical protein
MKQQLQDYENASNQDRATMEALSAALAAYRDQPPPATSVPLDFILTTIDGPIRDSVQSLVRPMVEGMVKDIEEKLQDQDGQLYGELWEKIALTLKVVDAVSKVTPPRPASIP